MPLPGRLKEAAAPPSSSAQWRSRSPLHSSVNSSLPDPSWAATTVWISQNIAPVTQEVQLKSKPSAWSHGGFPQIQDHLAKPCARNPSIQHHSGWMSHLPYIPQHHFTARPTYFFIAIELMLNTPALHQMSFLLKIWIHGNRAALYSDRHSPPLSWGPKLGERSPSEDNLQWITCACSWELLLPYDSLEI